LDLISKQLQRADSADDLRETDVSDEKTENLQTPPNKKEKQVRQFTEVANFSSKQSLFEFVV
ncbi:MAG TPA: hypothetical protein VFM46_06955, partial [Pseudomonadales bacterium]|nr:hypothetical protein [Pseudomonadales bacterium]